MTECNPLLEIAAVHAVALRMALGLPNGIRTEADLARLVDVLEGRAPDGHPATNQEDHPLSPQPSSEEN